MKSGGKKAAEKRRRVLSFGGVDPLKLFGSRERHLEVVDHAYPGAVVVRGDDIILSGTDDELDRLTYLFGELISIARGGRALAEADYHYLLKKKNGESSKDDFEALEKTVITTHRGRAIRPRTVGQLRYVEAIEAGDITFGIGPAGTGKTYLAVASAAAALKARQIERVFLVRPVVEAGESLGFLPGDFQAKLDPYVRPVLDALQDMLGAERTARLMDNGTVEIAPLAYMRGRTLNDAYVILDEAQNTTQLQMKMFLTRLGENAKAIVNGDVTQIDLAPPGRSGLLAAEKLLTRVEGIGFVYLGQDDIVRHRLVRHILSAFDGDTGADTGGRGGRTG